MSTLVTGTPGSGKTTLVQHAQQVGDTRFFDADEIVGLCEWRDLKTGQVLGLVTEHQETGEDSWYAQYGWYWRGDVLRAFLKDRPQAIVCGSSENITEYYELFGKIVVIKVNESELLHNLSQPTRNNPYGKTESQREGFMEWQEHLIVVAERFDSFVIEGNDTIRTYEAVCRKAMF